MTKVRACKDAGQTGSLTVTSHVAGKEYNAMTLPSELPFWELKSRWTPKFSKSDCKGQNPLDWGVLYIIRKVLKLKCLKWACMNHLETSNTSCGQKKGRESNWQFDSRPLKVENRLILLREGGIQHIPRKLSTRATTLLQTLSQSEVCTQSYGAPKL